MAGSTFDTPVSAVLDADLLAVFCRVAQARNFSRAANHLGMAQPIVTRKIKRLEDDLGVQLFVRSPEAGIIADHLIDCELRGLSFGGLPRALSIVEHIRALPPRRPITVLQEAPVSATLDGGEQVGYLVGRRATGIAIEKARAGGIAVVGASRTWFTGMYSHYLEKVAAAGLVGMIAGSGPSWWHRTAARKAATTPTRSPSASRRRRRRSSGTSAVRT